MDAARCGWPGALPTSLASSITVNGTNACARLAKEGLRNVDLRLFPLPKDRERFDALYWARTDYVYVAEEFADESLDLVIVDGAYRQHCAFLVLSKVKPGGLLLIDDTRHLPRLEDWQIPTDWARVYGPDAGIWSTTIWQKSMP